jgi:hypothetical protein
LRQLCCKATREVPNTQQGKKYRMTISDDLIRERAYQHWLKAGSPTGQNRIHWYRARAELEREQFDIERQDVGPRPPDEKVPEPMSKKSEST